MAGLGERKRFLWLKANKTWIVSWAVIIGSVFMVVHFWPQGPSPVPSAIREQAKFSIMYPAGYTYLNDWAYTDKDNSVQFTVKKDDYKVVFTEEKTPLEYQNDVAAYNRFIGSLRPRANFDVSLGTVSISNFVTAGDYQVVGETGILNSQGTFLLAHPDTHLTDDQWRALFESLKVD